MTRQFPTFTKAFKEYCFMYKDEVTTFLEMECDKIKFFRDLSMITKQELLFGMERKTYEEGDSIFEQGQPIDRLVVIQSGVVELAISYSKHMAEDFVIERLTAGAILNHQAFLVREIADTDFICRSAVSCFELSYERMKKVLNKRADLEQARKDIKQILYTPNQKVALDYIPHNHAASPEAYEKTLHSNELKVKFKNLAMQVWISIKREIGPRDMTDFINERLAKKKKRDQLMAMNK